MHTKPKTQQTAKEHPCSLPVPVLVDHLLPLQGINDPLVVLLLVSQAALHGRKLGHEVIFLHFELLQGGQFATYINTEGLTLYVLNIFFLTNMNTISIISTDIYLQDSNIWMRVPIWYKCQVKSQKILLYEIIYVSWNKFWHNKG